MTSSSLSDSSISGVTINTFSPFCILSMIRGLLLIRCLSDMIFVWIGSLPAGISSITLTSNSPKNANAIDLGIGVALIWRICGLSNCLKNHLCLTPNLCCSSMTASWILSLWTHSWISACVPTITSSVPALICSLILSFCHLLSDPVRSQTRIPSGRSIFAKVL